MANLQGYMDPFDALLQSRGAQRGAFTSKIQPLTSPNSAMLYQDVPTDSSGFYNQLSAIQDSINSRNQETANIVAQKQAQAQQEALMRRIRAMIPSYSPNGGGGGSTPTVSAPPHVSSPPPLPHLPSVYPPKSPFPSPVVAPPANPNPLCKLFPGVC